MQINDKPQFEPRLIFEPKFYSFIEVINVKKVLPCLDLEVQYSFISRDIFALFGIIWFISLQVLK